MAALAAAVVAVGGAVRAGGGCNGSGAAAWGAQRAGAARTSSLSTAGGQPRDFILAMNRTRLAVYWLLSSTLVAGASAWAVLRWHVAREHPSQATSPTGDARTDSEERFHAWVHGNLELTAAQHAALDKSEAAFAVRRGELRAAMTAANNSLREAVSRDRTDSPAVRVALDQLAAAQAALQRETMAHLFQMAAHLDSGEREKLIQWTHDSLLPPP